MHAIYLRLASIYLEKGEVRLFIFSCNNLEFYESDVTVGPNACLEMTDFESESSILLKQVFLSGFCELTLQNE